MVQISRSKTYWEILAKWDKPWLRTDAGPGIVPMATGTAPAGAGATDLTDSN